MKDQMNQYGGGRAESSAYDVCVQHERIYLKQFGCSDCYESSKIAPMDNSARAKQVGGSHYADMPIQPAEYAHANKIGELEFLCLRYISRHRNKNGRQDIEKAIHVLELLLELEYPE